MPHLIFLHGFLGLPSDWSPWTTKLPKSVTWEAPALAPQTESETPSAWARRFGESCPDGWIVGYSQGARLGLELLTLHPDHFSKALLVAPHPGIAEPSARSERLAHDLTWASRFLTLPWEEVHSLWEAQPLFCGHHWPRPEKLFSRRALSQSLDLWSVARQEPRGERLRDLPVTWVCGTHDLVTENRLLGCGVEPVRLEGGHRCLWQSPESFEFLLSNFIEENPRG